MKNKKIRIAVIAAFSVIIAVFAAAAIYLGDYYHADSAAIEAFSSGNSVVEQISESGVYTFGSGSEKYGFIFYPGGKVDPAAYAPLMRCLASKGIFCAVCSMPFRLAVLDVNAADEVIGNYPEVEHWFIGGHSLGGAIAARYVSEHSEKFEGIVLLAAYADKDISHSGLKVLSLYGDEDKVLNREKYADCLKNLPADAREYVIEGGSHAYFGMYGAQSGDGEPKVSNEEQIVISAREITAFIKGTVQTEMME